MQHAEPHPKAGTTVKVKAGLKHPQVEDFGGSEFRLEDWWDRVGGGSWMQARGNPACMMYALRTGFSQSPVPIDDEVVYGKIGPFGHLLHMSELDDTEASETVVEKDGAE